jgi:hypothetical protein
MILLWLFSILIHCDMSCGTCEWFYLQNEWQNIRITLRYILTLQYYYVNIDVQCEEYGLWHSLYIINMLLSNGNYQIKLFMQQPLHSNTLFVFVLFMLEHQPQDKQIPLDLWENLNYIRSLHELQKRFRLPQPVLQKSYSCDNVEGWSK